jgi:hypothetical protein
MLISLYAHDPKSLGRQMWSKYKYTQKKVQKYPINLRMGSSICRSAYRTYDVPTAATGSPYLKCYAPVTALSSSGNGPSC